MRYTGFKFWLFFTFIAWQPIISQVDKEVAISIDSLEVYKIELIDGTIFVGHILEENTAFVIFQTSSIPKIEIPKTKIRSLTEIESGGIKNGEYWFPNPNATRYLFGPSAYNLKRGEGYYQNTYLILNSFNVGLTDYLSLGGGLEFISTFSALAGNGSAPVFYITPKVGFKISDKFNMGGGVIYANSTESNAALTNGFGIAYGVGTYGSIEHNITGGLGWGYIDGDFSDRPFITVSGITRIAKKSALVTENWFVPGDRYYALYSYGIRFFGEKLAIDLALLNNRDIFEILVIGIPYINFVVKF